MPIGPGKYDDICTLTREQAEARAAIVIVLDGNKGGGFSVQTLDPTVTLLLPALLEQVARDMRAALDQGEV